MVGCPRHWVLGSREESSENRCVKDNGSPAIANVVKAFESQ